VRDWIAKKTEEVTQGGANTRLLLRRGKKGDRQRDHNIEERTVQRLRDPVKGRTYLDDMAPGFKHPKSGRKRPNTDVTSWGGEKSLNAESMLAKYTDVRCHPLRRENPRKSQERGEMREICSLNEKNDTFTPTR